MLALHHLGSKSVNHHDPPIGVVHVHLHKQKRIVIHLQNNKAGKKAHPCKVEVTDYPYQNSIATCRTADMQNQHITAELPSIIATTSCDIRVRPCVWCTCYNML